MRIAKLALAGLALLSVAGLSAPAGTQDTKEPKRVPPADTPAQPQPPKPAPPPIEPQPILPPQPGPVFPQPIPPQPLAPTPAPGPQPSKLPQLIPPPPPTVAPAQPGPPKSVTDPDGLFSFTVPGDWTVFATGGGNAAAYSPGLKAKISVLSSAKPYTTLDGWAESYVSGQTLTPTVKLLRHDAGQVAGHRAMHFLTEGDLVGNPVRSDSYFIDGDRHIFIMNLACATDDYAQIQPLFAQMVANLRFNVPPTRPASAPLPETYDPFPAPKPFPSAPGQPSPVPPPAVPMPTLPTTPAPPAVPTMPMPMVPPPPAAPVQGALRQVADAEGILSFSVPSDWQVQQQARGVAACDTARPASVAARADPKQAQNLDELARASIASWQQQVPQWKEIDRQTLQISGRPALIIRSSGAPGGTAVVGDHVFVLTDTWQAGLTVWCAQADFAQREAVFRQIIRSFQVR